MNIVEAKQEIKQTITVYLRKNEYGEYNIDKTRQRPVFLIGAPGIGKTAIMSQIAKEMDIGFISYSITHHTRQSAIGLPYIEKKTFGGKEYSVTEYTMSEIIAKVYETIEKQNKKEGILFIDEINCVSETLAPAMLELLQNKRFGPHAVPEGWILVSAGNPQEYNRSANEFDTVTLDRVKKIEATSDFSVWKKYAYEKSVHESIIGYLSVKPQNLFVMEKTVDGTEFVTPRGWEDLSVSITEYEKAGFEVTEGLISEYVQNKAVSAEFYRYYLLFEKYKQDYNVYDIMEGKFGSFEKFKESKFDERYAMIEVFIGAVTVFCKKTNSESEAVKIISEIYDKIKSRKESDAKEYVDKQIDAYENKVASEYYSSEEKSFYKSIIINLKSGISEKTLKERKEKLIAETAKNEKKISNTFTFLEKCFGKGQEITAYLVNLLADYPFVMYVADFGSESFYKYNEMLMIDKQNSELKNQIKELKKLSE